MAPDTMTPEVSTPDKVAGETKKRPRRKRTRDATILRRINARARERQEAWRETGLEDLTKALTLKLGKDFRDLRKADRERYAAGEPEGNEYRGRTQRFGK